MPKSEPSQINMMQVYRPVCAKCAGLMLLARIEPSDEPDHDLRTFECPFCQHTEVVEVKFR